MSNFDLSKYKLIDSGDLGYSIGRIARKYGNKWYSDNIIAYEEDIKREHKDCINTENGLVLEVLECRLELVEVGKVPLTIKWLEAYYYKNNEAYINSDYYDLEYYI